jgi:hypothetical protein
LVLFKVVIVEVQALLERVFDGRGGLWHRPGAQNHLAAIAAVVHDVALPVVSILGKVLAKMGSAGLLAAKRS